MHGIISITGRKQRRYELFFVKEILFILSIPV
jgi:hypothetical protein